MPGEFFSIKADEVKESSGGQTEGMIRKAAIVGKCEGICASGIKTIPVSPHSILDIHMFYYYWNEAIWNDFGLTSLVVMIAKPHSESAVHHHGEQGKQYLLTFLLISY